MFVRIERCPPRRKALESCSIQSKVVKCIARDVPRTTRRVSYTSTDEIPVWKADDRHDAPASIRPDLIYVREAPIDFIGEIFQIRRARFTTSVYARDRWIVPSYVVTPVLHRLEGSTEEGSTSRWITDPRRELLPRRVRVTANTKWIGVNTCEDGRRS